MVGKIASGGIGPEAKRGKRWTVRAGVGVLIREGRIKVNIEAKNGWPGAKKYCDVGPFSSGDIVDKPQKSSDPKV